MPFPAGHDDTQDTLQVGVWTDILSRSFQAAEPPRLHRLESIATSHEAHLDLPTMPGTDINDRSAPPGTDGLGPTPTIFNGLLRGLAGSQPASVSVVHYGWMPGPDNRFTEYVNVVQARTRDGVPTRAYAPRNPYTGNSSPPVVTRFSSWLADPVCDSQTPPSVCGDGPP